MKRITVFFGLLFLCTLCKAQTFNLAIKSGYSINRAACAGMDVGLNFKGIGIRGGFDAHLTDKVNNGAVMHLQIGHSFDFNSFYITPGIGRAYIYKSADKTNLNYGAMYYEIEMGYKFEIKGDPVAWILSGSKAGGFIIVQTGIRAYFN